MPASDIVRAWFTERLATGAIARDTEAYNQAAQALPDLIERLGAADAAAATAVRAAADLMAPEPVPAPAAPIAALAKPVAEPSATPSA